MSKTLAEEYLQEYGNKTNLLIKQYLQTKIRDASKIGNIPAQLLKKVLQLSQKGKKTRGALVILGYEAAGGKDKEAILDASIFIELFHTGLLIHDDIMDQDNLRRGIPTLHVYYKNLAKQIEVKTKKEHYGQSMAICAGDIAFFLAYDKLFNSNFPKHFIIKAAKIFAQYSIRVGHGQVLDIANTTLQKIKEDEILTIIQLKTAEYSGALPLLIGATLAGLKDEKKQKALKEYGTSLGWAFQIKDDILGMFGSQDQIGKPIGSDLREGKNTLLTLHLAKNGNQQQQKFQEQVLGKQNITTKDIIKMRQILKDSGSYDYVLDLGWKYVTKGKRSIPKITAEQKLMEILESLIHFTMQRVK